VITVNEIPATGRIHHLSYTWSDEALALKNTVLKIVWSRQW
jgi:hypothetical protein